MVEVTLAGVKWDVTAGCDIHLIPGLRSPHLAQLLLGVDRNPGANDSFPALTDMAGITLSFTAAFLGAPAAHSVTLDPGTGEVTVDSDWLAGLASFLVTATARQHGGTQFHTRIRVNIHGHVTRMWLTPRSLTLRKGAKNVRLSVLARFGDDGVIGDITNWSPSQPITGAMDRRHVRRSGSDLPVLNWSPAPATPGGPVRVAVDPVTGLLATDQETGASKIVVTYDQETAEALVNCAKPWDTPVRIRRVAPTRKDARVVGPGVKGMGTVPNVLFLPDGFREGQRGEFERLVRMTVTRMASPNGVRPLAYLRMNYFMAWVPSPEDGVSVLNELYGFANPGNDDPVAVSPVEQPSLLMWPLGEHIAHLIRQVGLATPADARIGWSLAEKIDDWRALYGPNIVRPSPSLYAQWLARGTRLLADERDTAFHMAFGSRPTLEVDWPSDRLRPNPRRLHADDFNEFLDALIGPNDEPLPKVWSTGKDKDLVVVLCPSSYPARANRSRPHDPAVPVNMLGLSRSDIPSHYVKDATRAFAFDLVDVPIARSGERRDIVFWLGLAQELGRSWGLGDEHGAENPLVLLTDEDILRLGSAINLQTRESLAPIGTLEADRIKWGRWPRITKAGVLRVKLERVGLDRFKIPLRSNAAAKFAVDDIVRLRTRPLLESTGPSGRFQVIGVESNDVTISPLPGVTVDPDRLDEQYPPGSILMAPTRADDPDKAAGLYGDDLMLMTDGARERIDFTQNPLNAWPLASEAGPPNDFPARQCVNTVWPIPTRARNFPQRAAPSPPRFSSWVIGLYENGGGDNCDIFRPTGVCLMHTHSILLNGDRAFYGFCLVCQYVIADLVDPTAHTQVEKDYVERYE